MTNQTLANPSVRERLDAVNSALDSLVNLRDLGGLPLRDGGTTRPGVLWRADAPYPDDVAPENVSTWPPATVIDLRSEPELERVSVDWPEGTAFHHHPIHAAAVPDNLRAQGDLGDLYEFILDAVPGRVASVIDIVGAPGQSAPFLVHCAAGKDRTGLVVASLLLAAGVEPEAVVADYLDTAQNVEALQERWVHKHGRAHTVRDAWLQTPEPAIRQVVKFLESWPGGASAWLGDHGADREHLARWCERIA